jgi:D-glycero-D-manno-heptose 1,7-bisphosphate phosphatase
MGGLGEPMKRAVFLDRDGVLNRAFLRGGVLNPPQSPHEVEILPGAAEACRLLRQAGYVLIVVTNQPDVARGRQCREAVEAINRAVLSAVGVDDVRVCYHDDVDACDCRKPSPGMILETGRVWRIDLSLSFMVGDRWRDIEAGRRAGCRTVLVGEYEEEGRRVVPDYHVDSLGTAVEIILKERIGEEVKMR